MGDLSNASSEVEYDRALGILLGAPGRGVPCIIEMVSLTRLDCVLGSAALQRQVTRRALFHTQQRSAFGAPLNRQPLMRSVLTDLCVESEASISVAARLARATDAQYRAGNDAERHFARIACAIAKYFVCKRTPTVVAEALECHGGNGYVEDNSPLPRFYRQAPLNSIWEGSGNVMCLDVLRCRSDRDAMSAFASEISAHRGSDDLYDAHVDNLIKDLGRETDLATMRGLVDRMAVALIAACLLGDASRGVDGSDDVAQTYIASRLGKDSVLYGQNLERKGLESMPPSLRHATVLREKPAIQRLLVDLDYESLAGDICRSMIEKDASSTDVQQFKKIVHEITSSYQKAVSEIMLLPESRVWSECTDVVLAGSHCFAKVYGAVWSMIVSNEAKGLGLYERTVRTMTKKLDAKKRKSKKLERAYHHQRPACRDVGTLYCDAASVKKRFDAALRRVVERCVNLSQVDDLFHYFVEEDIDDAQKAVTPRDRHLLRRRDSLTRLIDKLSKECSMSKNSKSLIEGALDESTKNETLPTLGTVREVLCPILTLPASLKRVARVCEKTVLRHGASTGDASNVCDVVRGMIESRGNGMQGCAVILVAIAADDDLRIVRLKDRFLSRPSGGGWRDLLVNVAVPLPSGGEHVCEIQVVHPQLVAARTGLPGHEIYARVRNSIEILERRSGPAAVATMLELNEHNKVYTKKEHLQLKRSGSSSAPWVSSIAKIIGKHYGQDLAYLYPNERVKQNDDEDATTILNNDCPVSAFDSPYFIASLSRCSVNRLRRDYLSGLVACISGATPHPSRYCLMSALNTLGNLFLGSAHRGMSFKIFELWSRHEISSVRKHARDAIYAIGHPDFVFFLRLCGDLTKMSASSR
eukprot:g3579.t1